MTNLQNITLEEAKRAYNSLKKLYEREREEVREYNEKNATGHLDEKRKSVDFEVVRVLYEGKIHFYAGTELDCLFGIAKALNRLNDNKVLIKKLNQYKKEYLKKIAWQKDSNRQERGWYQQAIDMLSFLDEDENEINLNAYAIVSMDGKGIGVYNANIQEYVSNIYHISKAEHVAERMTEYLRNLIDSFIEIVKELDNTIEIYETKRSGYKLFSNAYREQKDYVKSLFGFSEEELQDEKK